MRYIVQINKMNNGMDKTQHAVSALNGTIIKQLGVINSLVLNLPRCKQCKDTKAHIKKIKNVFAKHNTETLSIEKDI